MIIKRDPQEIADFFGCKVQVNPYTYNVDLWDSNGDIRDCVGYLDHQIVLKSNMADGNSTYEPKEKQEKSEGNSPNSENKNCPCYQDFTDSDNNAPHQSEVHTHKEYEIIVKVGPHAVWELRAEVNRAIECGWSPLGGISVSHSHEGNPCIYQAMVRGVC